MIENVEYNCETCLFRYNCPSCTSWGCPNHTPDPDDDYELGNYIEGQRREFYDEWRAYVSDDWD